MMDDANLGARIMAASGGGLEALLNTTENFITVPRHEILVGTNDDGGRRRRTCEC